MIARPGVYDTSPEAYRGRQCATEELMEPLIKSQFSAEILEEALSRYGVRRSDVSELGGFESFVYECSRADEELILRISHSLHRSADEISAELEWIRYLSANAVNACGAVPSLQGNLLEILGDGDEYFTAAAFAKAPGRTADEAIWQPPLFEEMGRMMGQMHALSKSYAPAATSFRRPDWHEETTGIAEKFLPAKDVNIIGKFNELQAATSALAADADSFGLVHIDFHRGNFFVDQGRVYLFDFDDCQYSWFADDIAIALFYAVPHDCASLEDLASARTFMRSFMAGYRTENVLSSQWLERIPMFLKRREMDLYTAIHRSLDVNNLDEWAGSFMAGRASKIENDVPYVDIDFSSL